MELLESIAKLSAPLDGAKLSLESVLKSFHAARDKHIFRILSTIASCDHTMQARTRALQELPDRTKSLGDGVAEWVKNLVKRCAMGESLNASVTNQCVLLAKDCVSEGDIPACAALLAAVKFAVDIFPALCSSENIFENLTELFTTCRSVTGATKKELQALGIVTALSSILSTVAVVPTSKDLPGNGLHENDMKQQLTQLCLRDGTPEQTRNAVHALARFVCPSGQSEIPATDEDFVSLLQLLTSASRLKIPTDKRESMKVVCALSALSALASSAPLVLTSSTRGDKAFKFALESILIGRENANADQGPDSDDDEASIEGSPASPSLKGGRHSSASKRKNLTPEVKPSLLEDEHLSLSCRTICASVDFLVSHVRSVSLLRASVGLSVSLSNTILSPSNEQIQRLFQLLTQILDDQGLPPSAKDSRSCMSRQDRAALRQTAGVGLIRLCDIRLGLEKEMLTPAMWISLGNTFLDEELSVRDVVLEEYSTFLKCTGIYGIERSNHLSKVPSLRFLSYVVLCNEGDCKSAAKICVSNLRITTEANYRKQCALGKEAEQKFEAYQKMLTMPEYCVPFAYYLLSHRKDTPSDGAVNQTVDSSDNEDDSMRPDYEAQHRMLRKRLKHLFDPLVNSLGDGADNISFLLRMTEIIGKRYTPLDPFLSCSNRRSIGSNGGIVDQPSAPNKRKSTQLDGRLKAICSVASEVLSSYVKIDKNLSTFFGSIHVPKSVFETKPIKRGGIVSTCIPVENSASHSTSRRSVTFSPEVSFRNGKIAEQLTPQLNHPQREPSSQSAARPAALLRSFPPSPNPVLNSRAVDRSTSFQSPGQQNENAKNDLSLKSSSGASTVTLSQNPSIEASSSKTLPECSEESSQPFSSHNEQPLKRRSRLSSSSKSDRRVVKKKSKAKPDALPKQINVVKIKARKHLDDLDFDFRDSENKPVSRNASNHQELKTTRSTRRQK